MFDAGLLCGYGGHSTLCFASASVGLAYVFVNQRIFVRQDTTNTFSKDIYKSEISYNIGIPWQAHLFTKFSELSKTGIGLTIGGNINKSRSLFYVLFSLEIGTF